MSTGLLTQNDAEFATPVFRQANTQDIKWGDRSPSSERATETAEFNSGRAVQKQLRFTHRHEPRGDVGKWRMLVFSKGFRSFIRELRRAECCNPLAVPGLIVLKPRAFAGRSTASVRRSSE